MVINCPYCILKGENKTLAEIVDGGVKVIRSGDYSKIPHFTVIKSKEFELICGDCGNTALYKGFKPLMPQFNVLMAWGTIMSYYAKGSFVG